MSSPRIPQHAAKNQVTNKSKQKKEGKKKLIYKPEWEGTNPYPERVVKKARGRKNPRKADEIL